MNKDISSNELQQLSEYLDGKLSTRERLQVEAALRSKPDLQKALEELRRTRLLLRHLPQKRAPRNFFITPEMVPQKFSRPLFPVFRLASAIAVILLVVVFAGDLLLGAASQPAASSTAPMLAQSRQGTSSAQEKSSAPLIIWGTPPQQAQSNSYGTGGGFGGGPTPGAQSLLPVSPTPTEGYGGGVTVSATPPPEQTPPSLVAALPSASTPTSQVSTNSASSVPSSQDQYASGPILGVNPTQGVAEAQALNNPQPAPFAIPRIDLHYIEGFLAFLAVLTGAAAFFFRRRAN